MEMLYVRFVLEVRAMANQPGSRSDEEEFRSVQSAMRVPIKYIAAVCAANAND
jgi:hypothetical protein